MNSILGTWRLVAEDAWDGSGQPRPTLFGLMPLGTITFTWAGRMMCVLADGRPDPIDGQRAFGAYGGAYTFDGTRLEIKVDGAVEPAMVGTVQIRDARFDGHRLLLRPPVGFRGAEDVTREVTWERIA
jgi:hypothetical protein